MVYSIICFIKLKCLNHLLTTLFCIPISRLINPFVFDVLLGLVVEDLGTKEVFLEIKNMALDIYLQQKKVELAGMALFMY